jgi:hypothetical protein
VIETIATSQRIGRWAELGGATAWVATLLIAAVATTPLTYDEPYYLAPVAAIHQYGLSFAFLANYPEATGIVQTIVQWLASPLTSLVPPGVRVVNAVQVAVALIAVGWLLRGSTSGDGRFALRLMALPPMWVISGLALTEPSAIALLAISLALVHRSANATMAQAMVLALLGGGAFAASVLAKQITLAASLGVVWLGVTQPRWRRPALVAGLTAAALLAPVFIAWGGFAPAITTLLRRDSVFSMHHATFAFGYAAILSAVIAYRYFVLRARDILFSAAAGLLVAELFGVESRPLWSVASRVLSSELLWVYEHAAPAVVISAGLLFLTSTIRHFLAATDPLWRASAIGLVAGLASLGAVTYSFSGRYVVVLAPLIAVVLYPHRRDDWLSALLLAIGYIGGAVSLLAYLRYLPQ